MRKICFLFLCIFTLHAELKEVFYFKELKEHITKDTLILLDIDDTLMIPNQMLGCDEWFMHRLTDNRQKYDNNNLALEKTLAEWEAIRHLTEMRLVEKDTARIVKELQDEGYMVMGLTTQGLALSTRTMQQLADLGIDLSETSISNKDVFFENSSSYTDKNHGVLFRKGILFTSGTFKGKALFKLCEEINFSPKRIVFINDKTSHLKDIESIALKKGVPYLGLRYGYSDIHKKTFKKDLADYQFKHSTFDKLLTDNEALLQCNLVDVE